MRRENLQAAVLRCLLFLPLWSLGCTEHAELKPDSLQGRDFSISLGRSFGSVETTMRFIWIKQINAWFGETEVTIRQFERVLGPNRKIEQFKSWPLYSPEWPAMMVQDRRGAERFCRALQKRFQLAPGYSFRLPTVAEWERAAFCDNPEAQIFPWGSSWPPSPMADGKLPNLWGMDQIPRWVDIKTKPVYFLYDRRPADDPRIRGYTDGHPGPAPVYESGKNPWGIYGLAGNISEWCYLDSTQREFALKGGFYGSGSIAKDYDLRIGYTEEFPYGTNPFTGTEDYRGSYQTGFRVIMAPSDRVE